MSDRTVLQRLSEVVEAGGVALSFLAKHVDGVEAWLALGDAGEAVVRRIADYGDEDMQWFEDTHPGDGLPEGHLALITRRAGQRVIVELDLPGWPSERCVDLAQQLTDAALEA